MDADRGVGGTWPARDHRNARLAGQLAVGLCHERGAAFVARQDQLDIVGVVQAVQRRQVTLARHGEDPPRALCPQAVHKHCSAVPFPLAHHCLLLLSA